MKQSQIHHEDLKARSSSLAQSLTELASQSEEHESEKQRRQSELTSVLAVLQDSEQELIALRRAVEEHGSRESEARHSLQLVEVELREARERLRAAQDGAAAATDQAEAASRTREEAREALEALSMRLQLEEAEARVAAVRAEEAAAMAAKELQKLHQVIVCSLRRVLLRPLLRPVPRSPPRLPSPISVFSQDVSDSSAKLNSLETALRLSESHRERVLEATKALEDQHAGLLLKCEAGDTELAAKKDQLEASQMELCFGSRNAYAVPIHDVTGTWI